MDGFELTGSLVSLVSVSESGFRVKISKSSKFPRSLLTTVEYKIDHISKKLKIVEEILMNSKIRFRTLRMF